VSDLDLCFLVDLDLNAEITKLCAAIDLRVQARPQISTSTGRLRRPQDLEGRLPAPQISDSSAEQHEDSANITYDLLVIGGGATGAGIALEAAAPGLEVALVERDDFSSGTSNKSTKMVHGGVRYLDKAFWELDCSQ
jgi:NADPH-dependent 2,4-dienoyl-CoA reductase/sulfur reductase-like enzyme